MANLAKELVVGSALMSYVVLGTPRSPKKGVRSIITPLIGLHLTLILDNYLRQGGWDTFRIQMGECFNSIKRPHSLVFELGLSSPRLAMVVEI
jgi:hypothetical protein